MVKNDQELYNVLLEFKEGIPVFRDLAEDNTSTPYIVYKSINSNRIYGSGHVIGNFKEFEINLVQKGKNDIKLKESLLKYLDKNNISTTNNVEMATNEDGEKYFFLTIFTSILENNIGDEDQ